MELLKKIFATIVFVVLTLVLIKFCWWILLVIVWLASGAVTCSLLKDWFGPAIERISEASETVTEESTEEVRPKAKSRKTTPRKPTSKKATKR